MKILSKKHLQNLLIVCILLFGSSFASAGKNHPYCAYKPIDIEKYGKQSFQNPPDLDAQNGRLETTLTVQYTDPKTTSIAGCGVRLRSYEGKLVGPTLRVKQGDIVNLLLKNRLPKESPNEIQAQFDQENQNAYLDTVPASFNTTNVHFHGLHVSPTGNSDNVLLAISPQSNFPYEVTLPKDHPIGSYWYHAHAHGSTSVQVGSGMAGAIVIEDNPSTTPKALLAANANEKIFVLQTILYNQKGELNNITSLFPGPSTPNPKDCSAAANKETWTCSHRRITINGQIVPIITMKRGEVQRWRLIDTAFRESIAFAVEQHDLHEIALDGNYLGRIDTWKAGTPIDLQPGYRSDVLIKASMTPGEYRIIDQPTSKLKSLRQVDEPENLLAILKVTDETDDMALPTSEEMAALAPFGDIDLSKQAVGVQEVAFKLGQDMPGKKNYFQVNYRAFNPDHVRQLELGAVDMWSLTTVGDPAAVPGAIPPLPHVFHIHVNPFQWQRIGPDGKPQMVWKDTLLVQGPAVTNVYTQYQTYTGKFVMHCHILDHEDLGMMEIEEVINTPVAHSH
ncbi:MAG: multicopper oxidase domain-containing protein [Nitrosomonas ureae]